MKDKALTIKRDLSLQQMVNQETKNREILTQFITNHMTKGVDFAPIHISKACQNKYACTIKGHFSKDNLTKAGAEKISSLLRLRAEWVKDADTWEMAGSRAGLFAYRCNLYNKATNNVEGMGLGACTIEEKGNANTAIKIAKKRAFVDAILATGALSDFFTQDLEDTTQEEKPLTPIQMREKIDEEKTTGVSHLITNKQINFIRALLHQKDTKGYDEAILKRKYDVVHMKELTAEQAQTIISNLMKLEDKQAETLPVGDIKPDEDPSWIKEDDVDPDEAEKGIEAMRRTLN